MDIMLIFTLDTIDENDNYLEICIPLSKLNEIKKTSNKNICLVNGYEVKGSFDNITYDINRLYNSCCVYPGERK